MTSGIVRVIVILTPIFRLLHTVKVFLYVFNTVFLYQLSYPLALLLPSPNMYLYVTISISYLSEKNWASFGRLDSVPMCTKQIESKAKASLDPVE